ncbi:DNA polymerase III subunit gamma/tau [bacterium]|nr:DNA polymerase III subunit gamma/tau [bacterium]
MSYIVMARKWRPQTFESVVGQEHIVRTLKNAILANRISHAYLFTGPRGVGKTTTARLLAKAVNCISPVKGEPCNHCVRCEEIIKGSVTDVIEIDAASNGLVDDARELREKVRYAPLTCRYKVMIIDEVHMMSNAAFNALLKTLEEPPAHSIFILATTESHKVPATIVSRCQRFDFRRIPAKEITERLAVMAAAENIVVDEEALHQVARGADGSLRDAQSLFDQIISFSGTRIEAADVVTVLGLVDAQVYIDLVDAIAERDAARALSLINELVNSGADLRQFMKDWVEYWRSLVIAQVMPDRLDQVLDLASNMLEAAARQSRLFVPEELTSLAKLAAATDDELRRTQNPRIVLELLLVRLCAAERVVSLEFLWHQLQDLETHWEKRQDKVMAVPQAGETVATAEANNSPSAAAKAEEKPSEEGEPALIVDSLEDAAPDSYLDKVRASWPDIMEAVGQENRVLQALLRDVKITAAEEGRVEINCASDYHAAGLQKEESRKVIGKVLEKTLGRATRIHVKGSKGVSQTEEAKPGKQQGREKEFEEIAQREPLVRKTLDMFGGRIVEVISNPASGK